MFLSARFINKTKPFIFILLILPSLFWLTKYLQGNFGVNPIDKLMDEIGRFSLKLIILTLLISSLSKFRSLGSLQNLRRMIGLFVFYYVSLHFLTYIFLDHYFNFNFIIKDIAKRPFITFGFISFLFLVPLAITSTNYMVKLLSFKIFSDNKTYSTLVIHIDGTLDFIIKKDEGNKAISSKEQIINHIISFYYYCPLLIL